MKALLVTTFFLTLILNSAAQDHEGDFWVLRAENKMADSLRESIRAKKLTPDAFSERVSGLIKQGKITELAQFTRPLTNSFSEDHIKMEKLDGLFKVRDLDLVLPMGVMLRVETSFFNPQRCDMAITAEISEKNTRKSYHWKNIWTSPIIAHRGWHLLHYWKNSSETTLLLTRVKSLPLKAATAPTQNRVCLDTELLEVSQSDLVKYKAATPENRAEAIKGLKERSTILSATSLRIGAAYPSVHEDTIVCYFENERWSRASLGLFLKVDNSLGYYGKEIDLALDANWQDPKKFRETPSYQFKFRQTVLTNQPTLIEPSIAPKKKADAIILMVTPRVEFLAEKKSSYITDPKPPLPDKVSIRGYNVEPSFYRKLVTKTSGKFEVKPLKDLLQLNGMTFPGETLARYKPTDSTVLLSQNKEGHLAFQKLVKELQAE